MRPDTPRTVAIAFSLLLTVALCVAGLGAVGVAAADDTPESGDGTAYLLVDGDLVIGDTEQTLGPIRAAGFDEDVEEVTIEIDLSVLEDHGVDVSNADVDLADEDVHDATLSSANVEDGVVRIVVDVDDRIGFAVDRFELTGLDTTSATHAEEIEYDVGFSEGEGVSDGAFALLDPDEVTPTVSPSELMLERGDQRITVADLQPAGEPITVEIDLGVLSEYDVDLEGLTATAESDAAGVDEATVEDGVVTVVAAPDDDVALFDLTVTVEGFTVPDGVDDPLVAEEVYYEATVSGDADDAVDVEPFRTYAETPTPVPDPDPSDDESPDDGSDDGTAVEQPADPGETDDDAAIGIVPALVALLLIALAATRRTASSSRVQT